MMKANSHKNGQPKDPAVKLAYQEGWISIGINGFLFVLKYWAGTATGSVAILADAWHTLSDSLSSVFVLVGARVSSKPPDKKHPYGHGRAELIASVFIAVLLGFISYDFIKESVLKLISREEVAFGTVAIVVMIVSIVLKEALAQYAFWAGRKADSNSLNADGWHHRTDAISSILILIGIFLGKYFWWIDGVLGIVVAIMILYAAYKILRDSISRLIGEAPHPELSKKLAGSAAKITPLDLNIHHIHLHTYGRHKELTFHIRLPEQMSVAKSHELAEKIERQIFDDHGMVTTIHVEPGR